MEALTLENRKISDVKRKMYMYKRLNVLNVFVSLVCIVIFIYSFIKTICIGKPVDYILSYMNMSNTASMYENGTIDVSVS